MISLLQFEAIAYHSLALLLHSSRVELASVSEDDVKTLVRMVKTREVVLLVGLGSKVKHIKQADDTVKCEHKIVKDYEEKHIKNWNRERA